MLHYSLGHQAIAKHRHQSSRNIHATPLGQNADDESASRHTLHWPRSHQQTVLAVVQAK